MYLVQKIENKYKFPLFLVEKKNVNIKKIVCGYIILPKLHLKKKKHIWSNVFQMTNGKCILVCTFSPHFFLKFRGNEVCGPKGKITPTPFFFSPQLNYGKLLLFFLSIFSPPYSYFFFSSQSNMHSVRL